MKVIVLGGGVIGVTTAYFLARDGHEVTVVDRRDLPASETSYANAGLVAPGHAYAWASPRAPGILLKSLFREGQALRLRPRADWRMWWWLLLFLRECTAERARTNTVHKLRLCLYSIEALHEVVSDTGVVYDGRRAGSLYLYRNRESFEAGVAHSAILRDHGLALEVVDAERAAELDPALAGVRARIAGAVYSPIDESGDARMFTRNLARHCQEKLGVQLALETDVRALATTRDRVDRAVSDRGSLEGDAYVLALGCDSPFLAARLGIRLPIYPVKGYSVTLPVGPGHEAPALGGVDEDHLVAYARIGDRLRITSTAEFSGYDRSHRVEDFRTMLRVARELFPNGASYDEPDYWAGLRPMTPGTVPVLGATPYRNLFLNTGHGHIGWTISCGSARVVADLVSGRKPELDLTGLTLQDDRRWTRSTVSG